MPATDQHPDFILPGMVKLTVVHMPACGCDLSTPDPEATLVQLGCVTGYIIERSSREHDYLSTGCLHGEHGYCQGTEGQAGPKTPGKCKFCAASCRCACHQGGEG